VKKSVTTGVTWGAERGKENAPLAFFYIRRVFLATELKRGKYKKNFHFSGGNGCLYIKDWLQPIFPLFLARLIRKLRFLIPMVDFSVALFLANLRLCV